jgi:hypothetical protein
MSPDPTAQIAVLGVEPTHTAREAAVLLGRSYSWLDQRLRKGHFIRTDGTMVQPLRTAGGQHAALRHSEPRLGIDAYPFHRAEIDDHPTVVGAVTRRAVPAAPHRHHQSVLDGERQRPLNISDTAAAGDDRRAAVDVAVPHPPGHVVTVVGVAKELTAEQRSQRPERILVDHCDIDRHLVHLDYPSIERHPPPRRCWRHPCPQPHRTQDPPPGPSPNHTGCPRWTFGQGALVLADGSKVRAPVLLLTPEWARIPMVLLATAATVIASQQ